MEIVDWDELRSWKTISWSEMNTFARCKRQWHLRYNERLKQKKDPAISSKHIGSLIHRGLESYYINGSFDKPLAEAKAQIEDEENDDIKKQMEKVYSLSDQVLYGYADWLRETNADSNLRVLRVEPETVFENARDLGISAPEGWGIKGYPDLIVQNMTTGNFSIMEHKTTIDTYDTWMGSTLHTLLWQARLYVLMGQAFNPGVNFSVIFNVLRRVKGTSRAARPLFWRYETSFSQSDLQRAKEVFGLRMGEISDQLKRKEISNYPNPSRMCSICDYRVICPSFDTEGEQAMNEIINEFFDRR